MTVCPGCSCLCDDVEIIDGKIRHACRIGYSLFRNRERGRARPIVNGNEVDIDKAIEEAVEILKDSKDVLIYGLVNTTVEAQNLALKIAEKLEGKVMCGSGFFRLAKLVMDERVRVGNLDDVRDYAYVIAYWGCDAHNSMPRHMSRYTYYPRGKKRQRGHEEDRFLVVIDVRRSHTAMLAKKNACFIEVKDDDRLVSEFLKALKGGVASGDVLRVVKEVRKADYNVIFGGEGLVKGLKDYDQFCEMVNEFGYFIPADYHPNSMGLFRQVKEGMLTDELKGEAVLVVGDDLLNSYKRPNCKIICVDPKMSFTARVADVVIPSSISGVESGGTMVRQDMVEVKLDPPFRSEVDDVYVLKRIERGL